MSVDKIMTKTLVIIDFDQPLSEVKEAFEREGFHHLLVTEKGRLVGVISDRDLLKSISPYIGTNAETLHDAATLRKRAHQIMTRNPLTLSPNSPVMEAVRLFNRKRVSCLPVVDDGQRPVGIVSWRDVMKAIEVTTTQRRERRDEPDRATD